MLADPLPDSLAGVLAARWPSPVRARLGPGRRPGRYPGLVTPEELANLAHLRRARDLMDRDYALPLDVAAIARAAFMSPAHFSRQFRAAYGETPYAYLMTRRIERAGRCHCAVTVP